MHSFAIRLPQRASIHSTSSYLPIRHIINPTAYRCSSAQSGSRTCRGTTVMSRSGGDIRSVKRGDLLVGWAPDGSAFSYSKDGKRFVYDMAAHKRRRAQSVPGGSGAAGRAAVPALGAVVVWRAGVSGQRNFAGRQAESLLQRPQLWLSGADGSNASRSPRTAARRRASSTPQELGLRRGAVPARGDLVVAGQQECGLLPFDESK